MLEVSGYAVGKIAFEICPDEFVGVKLRRISRKVKGLDTRMSSKVLSDELGAVERAPVPEKEDCSPEMLPEIPEKLLDLLGSNVFVGMESGVESQPIPLGRNGNGRDRRDFCPASGNNNPRGFTLVSPSALNVGDEREPALIQEDQVGSKPVGLFLYEAKRDTSNNGWLAPCVPWLSSAVSDSSSPGHSSGSTGSRCNNIPGNSSELSGRYVSASKDPLSNRPPEALLPGYSPKSSSVLATEAKDVLYWGLVLIPCDLSSCSSGASAPRNLKKLALPGLPHDKDGPVSTSGWQGVAVFPKSGVFHEVS